MIININKIKNFLVFGLLFLAAMNFQAKFFYFVFASLLLLFILQRKLMVVTDSLVYLLLGVFMAIYNYPEGALSMIRCMAWVAFYWVGYNLVVTRIARHQTQLDYDPVFAEKNGYALLVVISFGSFTHYLLNFLSNYGGVLDRNTNDIWTGKPMAATGQAALACIMCGLAVALIFAPRKKRHRIVGIALLIVLLAYNLILACRSLLVIILVLLIIGMLYLGKIMNNTYKRFKLFIGLAVTLLVLTTLFTLNVFNIQETLLNSNLFGRFDGSSADSASDIGRLQFKLQYIKEGYRYLFGGLHLRSQYGYAHDLWLDGYDEYGLFGLIFLIGVTLLGIKELLRLLRKTNYSREFKMTVSCIYVAMLLEFCVEPILEGMPWLFACFCLVNGCITGMIVTYKKNKGAINENTANQHRIR